MAFNLRETTLVLSVLATSFASKAGYFTNSPKYLQTHW
jgi:hypothetical protein